ncbi:TMEM43 family protein [Candidatus Peregrinibacteria bacterium]|nr:TMEM43 family protein [Candidatus Peregrinibacteria bacterium]
MANQFSETTTTGYGSRIINSIKGIVFGFILFIASFGVLYWNEGRVDVSSIAKTAIDISTSKSAPSDANGKLVSVSGVVTSDEKLGDDLFLKPGDYLAVSRVSEMYAWIEKSESKSEKNLGGSETTTTTYSYSQGWTSSPSSTSSFKEPAGHENPVKTIEDAQKTVGSSRISTYDLDLSKMGLPNYEKLLLTKDNTDLTKQGVLAGEYVYVGKGNSQTPQLGDMRISYTALKKNSQGTVFGKLDGQKISTYVDEKTNESLYRMFNGTRDESLKQMHSEYTMWLWIMRAVGFVMMWIGLASLFGPISVLLDVVPFFGSLSGAVIGLVTFVVALVLSVVTIFAAMILHSLVATIIAVVVAVAIVMFIIKVKGKKPNVVKA